MAQCERKGKDAKDARLHTNTRRRRALSGGCAAGLPDADGSVESEGDGEGGLSGGEAEKGPWRQKSCPVTAKQARSGSWSRKVGWSVRQSFVGLLYKTTSQDSTSYQKTTGQLHPRSKRSLS